MKRIVLIILALVLAVSMVAFAACGEEEEPEPQPPPTVEPKPEPKPEPEPEPKPEPEPAWEWPDKFLIASQGATTVNYALVAAWSPYLEEDTGMRVRIVVNEDPVMGRIWQKQHFLHLGTLQAGTSDDASGIGKWGVRDLGPWQDRMVWAQLKGGMGYAVRGDSGIKTPYDIKPGMKVLHLAFLGETGRRWITSLLAWAQVDPEDVIWVAGGNIQALHTSIRDGKADVTGGFPSSPVWLDVEASPHGLAWIELNSEEDPEGAARYLEVDPTVAFGPYGTSGAPSAAGVWMQSSLHGFSSAADLDAELIYNLCKWFDENYDKFKGSHPWAVHMTIENTLKIAETNFYPMHDGTIKLLKERGLWTADHDARNQQNIELLTRYVVAFQEAVAMADDKGIKVDPNNEEWIDLWENYKKELELPRYKMYLSFP